MITQAAPVTVGRMRPHATGNPNRFWLSHILQAQREQRSCLPRQLGLDMLEWQLLLLRHDLDLITQSTLRGDEYLYQELLEMRRDEWRALRNLLLSGRAGVDVDESAMASIVAAACLGSQHLWRDLGVSSRQDLSNLMAYNFPHLSQLNRNNMRWKKFLYRQLCEHGGDYVCRSPSCETCSTYLECFGEES